MTYNDVWRHQVHDVRDTNSNLSGRFSNNIFDLRVAIGDCTRQCATTDIPQVGTGVFENVGRLASVRSGSDLRCDDQPAGNRFQATSFPAAAKRSGRIDLNVTDLHARRRLASQDFPIVNATAADSCSRKYTDRCSCSLGNTKPILAVNTSIDIVHDEGRAIEDFFQSVLNANVGPAQVRRTLDNAFVEVQWPRTSDTNCRHVLGVRFC